MNNGLNNAAGQKCRSMYSLKHSFVVVEDSEVQLRARVHHVKLKCTLRPRHPSGEKSIIDDIGLRYAVFVHNGNEGIGLIAEKATGIKLRKSIATNDFHIQLSQFARTDVIPVARRLKRLLLKRFLGHPSRFFLALRVGARADTILSHGRLLGSVAMLFCKFIKSKANEISLSRGENVQPLKHHAQWHQLKSKVNKKINTYQLFRFW